MTEVVESIHLHDGETLAAQGCAFQVKAGRRTIVPDVVSSVCGESSAVLTYLYDALQPGPSHHLLRLHHALAPYKAAFMVDPSGPVELRELASYLSMSLRRAGLLTLPIPPDLCTTLTHHDCLGVPYTIVLTMATLTSGILGLRSRDTTLQEEVHVSKLTSYMLQLLNSS